MHCPWGTDGGCKGRASHTGIQQKVGRVVFRYYTYLLLLPQQCQQDA
jgi:hypothetical protein